MPRNEKQQQMNLATRTTTAKRLHFHFCFQFLVFVSSFHFIFISCFSICPSEHQTLFTHGFGMRLLPGVSCCSWSLHPNCILNLHLRHFWLMSTSTCYYFSTGDKFWLVSSSIELHTLTPAAHSFIDRRTVGTFGIVRYIVRHGSPLLRWRPLSRVSLYSFTWAHYLRDYRNVSLH